MSSDVTCSVLSWEPLLTSIAIEFSIYGFYGSVWLSGGRGIGASNSLLPSTKSI